MTDAIPWPVDQAIERRPLSKLVRYAKNARHHKASQIAEIVASMREFGWTIPLLVDEQDVIIAGDGRFQAATSLGIAEVPVLVARGWSDAQKRAYRLVDNQIPLNATWNKDLLRVELTELREQAADLDLELFGFATNDALIRDGGDAELPQAIQLQPAREYAVIMCDDLDEWERLKVALNLTPVRRGGYRQGSQFDDLGTQRVIKAKTVLELIEGASGQRPARRSAK